MKQLISQQLKCYSDFIIQIDLLWFQRVTFTLKTCIVWTSFLQYNFCKVKSEIYFQCLNGLILIIFKECIVLQFFYVLYLRMTLQRMFLNIFRWQFLYIGIILLFLHFEIFSILLVLLWNIGSFQGIYFKKL